MAATNSKIREQVAFSNLREAIPTIKGIRSENAKKQRLEQVLAASNALKNQQDREIVRLNTLIDQENIYHERRINDLNYKLHTITTNKFYLNQRTGWNENELWMVQNNKELLKEQMTGIHAKQTRQYKLKTAALKNIMNFEKEARKKAKARSTGSVRKAKTPTKRNSY